MESEIREVRCTVQEIRIWKNLFNKFCCILWLKKNPRNARRWHQSAFDVMELRFEAAAVAGKKGSV